MRKIVATLAVAAVVALSVSAQDSKVTLAAASQAMGAANLTSIQFSGSGTNNAFGQAFKPGGPWPAFKVTSYTVAINYKTPAARLALDRTNPDGPVRGGGGLPLLAPQKQIQLVSGKVAWNVNPNPAPGTQAANPALGTVNDRLLAIWTSPHGVIKGAQANNATVNGHVITFTANGTNVKATLGSDNLVQKVETMADAAVIGDTLTETTYSMYKDFAGVKFPTHVVQKQGGFPILDMMITDVKPNVSVAIDVPQNVQQVAANPPAPPPVRVQTDKVADGVYFLTGGTHHSVAIEFKDYVVLWEAPQTDERAMAVIDATKKAVPNKPIRYVVNTHNHFDHLGGVRAVMAEGLTILTQAENKSYYERIAAMTHTITTDRLARSPKKPVIETIGEKKVITDGTQTLEIYRLPTDHVDTLLIGYLPKAKMLLEVDLFNGPAVPNLNAPPANAAPTPINPATVAFYDQLQKMKLDVDQILAGHGGRIASIKDLRAAIGKASTN